MRICLNCKSKTRSNYLQECKLCGNAIVQCDRYTFNLLRVMHQIGFSVQRAQIEAALCVHDKEAPVWFCLNGFVEFGSFKQYDEILFQDLPAGWNFAIDDYDFFTSQKLKYFIFLDFSDEAWSKRNQEIRLAVSELENYYTEILNTKIHAVWRLGGYL